MKNYKWYDLQNGEGVHVNMDLVRYSTNNQDEVITLHFDKNHKLHVKEQKSAYEDGGLKVL